ncbi:MAG: hypothetical protein ABH864_03355 [archaeon]
MKIYFNKRAVQVEVKKVSFWGKFVGLMFKTRNTQNLLFEFGPSEPSTIHSFFVFFSFLALWLDKNNNVLESNIVKPFTPALTPKKRPTKLIEIPLNSRNKKFFDLLDGKGNI